MATFKINFEGEDYELQQWLKGVIEKNTPKVEPIQGLELQSVDYGEKLDTIILLLQQLLAVSTPVFPSYPQWDLTPYANPPIGVYRRTTTTGSCDGSEPSAPADHTNDLPY